MKSTGGVWLAAAIIGMSISACQAVPEDRCSSRGMDPGQPGYSNCVMYFSGFVEPELDGDKCEALGNTPNSEGYWQCMQAKGHHRETRGAWGLF